MTLTLENVAGATVAEFAQLIAERGSGRVTVREVIAEAERIGFPLGRGTPYSQVNSTLDRNPAFVRAGTGVFNVVKGARARPLRKIGKPGRVPRGAVVFEGPSPIDGGPIVAIVVWQSVNAKTGDMPQTFVMRADRPPVASAHLGTSRSVCGDCRHRHHHGEGGDCYVQLQWGPERVWFAHHDGLYPRLTPSLAREHLSGRRVRLGTYGDPVVVPYAFWRDMLEHADGHIGYTHQWRSRWIDPRYRGLLMASVDSLEEAMEARARGWRYFRVRTDRGRMLPREFVCPASNEEGNRLRCEQCMACSGNPNGRGGNVVIVMHGTTRAAKRAQLTIGGSAR